MKPYLFRNSRKSKEEGFIRHYYSFKTNFNRTYIVYADEFEPNLYIVKFFIKNHRQSKNKFKFMTNDGDARKVLDTCVAIGGEILENNPSACFGFIGEPRKKESRHRTKRFKVYLLYAAKHYNPFDWSHYEEENISAYFLLNQKNEGVTMANVQEVFKGYIEELD